MIIIKWKKSKDFIVYLCHTWQGNIVWTLNERRALILPKECAEIMINEIAVLGFMMPNDLEAEEVEIDYSIRKAHMENLPN
jgi:hypothetical protein